MPHVTCWFAQWSLRKLRDSFHPEKFCSIHLPTQTSKSIGSFHLSSLEKTTASLQQPSPIRNWNCRPSSGSPISNESLSNLTCPLRCTSLQQKATLMDLGGKWHREQFPKPSRDSSVESCAPCRLRGKRPYRMLSSKQALLQKQCLKPARALSTNRSRTV